MVEKERFRLVLGPCHGLDGTVEFTIRDKTGKEEFYFEMVFQGPMVVMARYVRLYQSGCLVYAPDNCCMEN